MMADTHTKVYVGAGNHELLRILWTGFQDGLAYGRTHADTASNQEADYVVDSAKVACERKLQTVEPLDRATFHPAYTYGWMAGYLAAYHDLDDGDGLLLSDPATHVEHARRVDTGPVTQ